jgi:penicillin-binding protein 1A
MDDPNLEEVWRPENSGGGFRGPMRLREALVQSRNLVSIRLLKEIGVRPVIEYVKNFGFANVDFPNNLTLALGSMGATPLDVASAFAVFSNGGFRVEPYYIERIEGPGGQILYTAEPKVVCAECVQPVRGVSDEERAKAKEVSPTFLPPTPLDAGARRTQPAERVISPQVAFIMNDIMKDVITRGTGRRALALGRGDLRGKTGTTNDSVDTWFNGFNNNIVASVWVGFDVPGPLGEGEEGARTAVPIWVDYMKEALRGVPESRHPMPEGIVELKVNGRSGGTRDADLDPVFEYFRVDNLPTEEGYVGGPGITPGDVDPYSPDASQPVPEPIF